MTRPEWLFVVGCMMVVFAMVGTMDVIIGVIVALFIGLTMWSLLAFMSDVEERKR